MIVDELACTLVQIQWLFVLCLLSFFFYHSMPLLMFKLTSSLLDNKIPHPHAKHEKQLKNTRLVFHSDSNAEQLTCSIHSPSTVMGHSHAI